MNLRFFISFEAILEGLRRVGGAYWLHFARLWRIWAAFVWIGTNVGLEAKLVKNFIQQFQFLDA